jgi:hypothetical protein
MTTIYLVGGLVVLAGLIVWWAMREARKTGELKQRAETGEASVRYAQKAAKIDEDVVRADPSKLRDELHNRKP